MIRLTRIAALSSLLFLALALLATPAFADVIPPNVKPVDSVTKVTGLKAKAFKDKRFIIAPTNRFGNEKDWTFKLIKEGEALSWGRYTSPWIYVIDDPKLDLKTIDTKWFNAKGRVRSKVQLTRSRFVDDKSPVEKIVHDYQLKEIKNGVLVVALKTSKFDKAGKLLSAAEIKKSKTRRAALIILLPILGLLAGLAISVLSLRRRRQGEDSETEPAAKSKSLVAAS